jgi:hypothetical protein
MNPEDAVSEEKIAEFGRLFDALPAEQRAVIDGLGELEAKYGDDFERDAADFEREHGCSPAEWVRRGLARNP